MFESLIVLLREGVEAALIIGIALAVLQRSGRKDLAKPVYWGLALAIAASIAAAVGLEHLPVSGEAVEGALYTISAVFVASMLVWMHRKARLLKGEFEARMARTHTPAEVWGLGAFTFLMVFREGAETVLFLSAIRLTTDGVMTLIGAGIGLAIAVGFGILFVKGSVRVDLRRFFFVTECVLVLFVVQLLVNGYHEFSEVGILPATRDTMAVVGPIVKNGTLFLFALVAIPLFIFVSGGSPDPDLGGLSEAERRLAVAKVRRERFYRRGAVATALFILASVGVAYAHEKMPRDFDPPVPVEPVNGSVRLDLGPFEDGLLHRYSVSAGSRSVRFFVLATEDGKVRTVLDACEICGPKGYVQEESILLCLNCEAEIVPATVGLAGGCNPIPLESRIEGGELVIPFSALEEAARWFEEVAGEAGKCAVCGMGITIHESTPWATHEGHTYHFCGMGGCRERFLEDPAKYAE